MPLQTFDFGSVYKHKPDHSGIGDIFSNIYKGYELAQTPEKLRREKLAVDLQNQIFGTQAKYAEPMAQADMALKQAQAAKALRESNNPDANLQGIARDWHDLQVLENMYGPEHPIVKGAKKDFENKQKVQQSLYTQREQIYEYRNLNSLPSDQKEKIYGQYAGLGIDSRTGTELWNQDITPEIIHSFKQQFPEATLDQIVNFSKMQTGQQGSPNQAVPNQQMPEQTPGQVLGNQIADKVLPPPIDTRQAPIQPAMTSTNRTDYNTLQANRAESSYLGSWVTEHNAPYSQFPTMKDAYTSLMKRNDPAAQQERHEFLAAQMMGPETALLNIKLAQGSNASRAIADIEDRLKLNAKKLGITVTPEDYLAATRIMHQVLDKAGEVRGQALQGQMNIGASQMTPGMTSAPSVQQNNYDPFGIL